ncbi:MAG: Uma2 family endonuclease [Synechococcales bacterium]|nr:Uma2 family endonuclease [Synechococcales bacterium]
MTATATATFLAPPTEIIHLSGISWQTYETLLEELSDRRLRLTYNRGTLEIMAPSPEHELSKKLIGRFVETLAEESGLSIYPLGSTTFQRPELSGAEPDECFYFQNIAVVRGKKRLDLSMDPAPDLVVEIDITSSSQSRLQVYADLGVAEVWIYDGKLFTVYQFINGTYVISPDSQFFPSLPIPEMAHFLQQASTMDYLELVKVFRSWVRSQLDALLGQLSTN